MGYSPYKKLLETDNDMDMEIIRAALAALHDLELAAAYVITCMS
ncbi:hypothetical protein EDD76_12019 [Kineothrix alysoides]|uniref:Uncharacterized protein n=1 Tax=Kineothrix alysoides TaxID=1469948 RepID=A0A4V2QB30_9FIRM|nr:hypothetical protein [Kineothrix alysoides]TCL54422.1 hypothetical protein EDD76_12019 [Kineothrix alysoides]